MATSTSSLASSAAALTAPPTFTGVSKFATSLQSVLARAVGIASLPLDALQAGLTDLTDKRSALQSMDSTFLNLQESVSSLDFAVSNSLLTPTISDPTIVSANVQPGATAGTYSVEVDNLGAYSTAISNPGSSTVTNPATQGITTSPMVSLTIGGGTPVTITPASSDLQDLASAINAQAGSQVQASVVNIGSTNSPDYRLSLTAVNLGLGAIGLTYTSGTTPASLIQTSTPGSPATYIVDGSSGSISSTSRTITLAPGLTVNLLNASIGKPVTVTVADDPTSLASAFSSFVTAYNAASTAVGQQHGASAGVLQGDSLLQTLSGVLSQLGTYSNGTPSSALANFGITVDSIGQLSIDTTAFTNAANANFPALLATLGSSTTGGFLQTATNLLGGIEDATTGFIPSDEADLATQITAPADPDCQRAGHRGPTADKSDRADSPGRCGHRIAREPGDLRDGTFWTIYRRHQYPIQWTLNALRHSTVWRVSGKPRAGAIGKTSRRWLRLSRNTPCRGTPASWKNIWGFSGRR
jgi:flagellar hook-associated protein 2